MASHTGSCQCGKVRVTVAADPRVGMCFCKDCQRRTGSAVSIHAYYPEESVTIEGAVKAYTRPGDTGCLVSFNFCPDCGSTMFWEAEADPGNLGVPVGLFADPMLPAPVSAVFVPHKPHWFVIPEGATQREGHSVTFLAGAAAVLARRGT